MIEEITAPAAITSSELTPSDLQRRGRFSTMMHIMECGHCIQMHHMI